MFRDTRATQTPQQDPKSRSLNGGSCKVPGVWVPGFRVEVWKGVNSQGSNGFSKDSESQKVGTWVWEDSC